LTLLVIFPCMHALAIVASSAGIEFRQLPGLSPLSDWGDTSVTRTIINHQLTVNARVRS
jgi:hypothetical protein